MTENIRMYNDTISFIRSVFDTDAFIPLHEPRFIGKEKEYLNECIDSTFVSSVGKFVDLFEEKMAAYTGAKRAVALMNGTAALHIAMVASGVEPGDEVITQPLTFVATCNAINYCSAKPVFVDVDRHTLGMSPTSLATFLNEFGELRNDGFTYNKKTGKKISACVPMHTFGHPVEIEAIAKLCQDYNIALVEDAAESPGSFYKGKHTGTFGKIGTFSFNGNKTITCGGGGCIITDDDELGQHIKHLTTTSKVPHKWEYVHDNVGYNYRMPNLNAALICAQMEQLASFVENKRALANLYKEHFDKKGIHFFTEPDNSKSNYWLNAVLLKDHTERDAFLTETNQSGVMTRPVWKLMNSLSMYSDCQTTDLSNAEWIETRLVNIPSSVRLS